MNKKNHGQMSFLCELTKNPRLHTESYTAVPLYSVTHSSAKDPPAVTTSLNPYLSDVTKGLF